MNPQQLFAEINRRNIPRLYVAYVTACLLVIQTAAILLGIFEVAAWGMKAFVAALAPGKGHVPANYPDRSMRY